MENTNKPAVKKEQTITDMVLEKVKNLQGIGHIKLPSDYSPENALKGAWIILQDVETKDKKRALDVCDKNSIVLALFKMVTEGLTPLRKQGSFIQGEIN